MKHEVYEQHNIILSELLATLLLELSYSNTTSNYKRMDAILNYESYTSWTASLKHTTVKIDFEKIEGGGSQKKKIFKKMQEL